MRDIGKYRGQAKNEYHTSHVSIDEGDWVYGYYYFCRRRMSGIIVTTLEAECGGVGSGLVQVEIEVIPETVGESIRRKDKNGVEIYEGDKWRLSGKTFIVTYGESRPYELGEVVG